MAATEKRSVSARWPCTAVSPGRNWVILWPCRSCRRRPTHSPIPKSCTIIFSGASNEKSTGATAIRPSASRSKSSRRWRAPKIASSLPAAWRRLPRPCMRFSRTTLTWWWPTTPTGVPGSFWLRYCTVTASKSQWCRRATIKQSKRRSVRRRASWSVSRRPIPIIGSSISSASPRSAGAIAWRLSSTRLSRRLTTSARWSTASISCFIPRRNTWPGTTISWRARFSARPISSMVFAPCSTSRGRFWCAAWRLSPSAWSDRMAMLRRSPNF